MVAEAAVAVAAMTVATTEAVVAVAMTAEETTRGFRAAG